MCGCSATVAAKTLSAGRESRPERNVRKINKELWLLLFLVLIAAMIHFLVASQAVVLVFYFLPTLYSAYHFGRRHATLTACASVCFVVLPHLPESRHVQSSDGAVAGRQPLV